MLVPCKEMVVVVAVGLWSMLSIAAVVKQLFLRTGGQTTPSSSYLLTECLEVDAPILYVEIRYTLESVP